MSKVKSTNYIHKLPPKTHETIRNEDKKALWKRVSLLSCFF